MNQSLAKLWERVGIHEAMVQLAEETGQELPFEDHSPYSNQGMEDLLEMNEIMVTIQTEIIPPRSNKTIKAHMPLVLFGMSMNVITEPLHRNNKALPQGFHELPSYTTYNCGSRQTMFQLYNTRDHAIILKKGTLMA